MRAQHSPGRHALTGLTVAVAALTVVALLPTSAGATMVETHPSVPAVVTPHTVTAVPAPSQAPTSQNLGGGSPGSAPSRPAPAAGARPAPKGSGGGSQPAPTAATVPAASRPPLTPPGRSDPTCGLECKETWADFAWDQFLVNWTESIQVPLIWNPSNFLSISFAARRAMLWAIKVHDIEAEIKAEEKAIEKQKTSDSGSETEDGEALASEESPAGEQVASNDPKSCPDPNSREVYESVIGGGVYRCY